MRRGWAVGVMLIALLCAARAWCADVNAPLDERPTIASEIRRGFQAGHKCEESDLAAEEQICIERLSVAEGARLANIEPFRLGVNLFAWLDYDRKAQTPETTKAERMFFVLQAKLAFIETNSDRERLDVTREQLFAASGFSDAALWNQYAASAVAAGGVDSAGGL